jgi:magnesium-transporting ATPase (P-type)
VQQGDLQHDTQEIETVVRDNSIVTTKYAMLNFMPKFTFEFVTKPINAYFLFVCVLQSIPQVSSTDGIPTLLFTVLLIWWVDMTLAGIEDYNRRIADQKENARPYMVLDAKQRAFVSKPSCEIAAGDIVKLQDGDPVPADLMVMHIRYAISILVSLVSPSAPFAILLLHSHPDSSLRRRSTDAAGAHATTDPVCYVETKGLDGETNLKLKRPVRELSQKIRSILGNGTAAGTATGTAAALLALESDVKCEMPNERVHSFEGTIDITPSDLDEPIVPVSYNSVLLRGSVVRSINAGNESSIGSSLCGLVLYSGHETKVHMSASKGSRRKMSQLEQRLQWLIVFLGFGGCGVFCLVGAAYELGMMCNAVEMVGAWYLNINQPPMPSGTKALTSDLAWFTFWESVAVYFQIMYAFVPVSLVVSLDLARMFAQRLIGYDLLMYDQSSDTPCELKTLSLVEELGQVTHLFSDKTGTLTDNIMQFRRFSVAGRVYGMRERDAKQVDGVGGALEHSHVHFVDAHSDGEECIGGSGGNSGAGGDSYSVQATMEGRYGHGQKMRLRHFLHMLAVNHSVTTQRTPEQSSTAAQRDSLDSSTATSTGSRKKPTSKYSAASPDEIAFVDGADFLGVRFCGRKATLCTVVEDGGQVRVEEVQERKEGQEGQGAAGGGRAYPYEVLQQLEFDSVRMRSSVVVRLPAGAPRPYGYGMAESGEEGGGEDVRARDGVGGAVQGELWLYTKGADTSLLEPAIQRSLDLNNSVSGLSDASILGRSGRSDSSAVHDDSVDSSVNSRAGIAASQTSEAGEGAEEEAQEYQQLLLQLQSQVELASGEDGLRSLVWGGRRLRETEYADWSSRYREAKVSSAAGGDKATALTELMLELEEGSGGSRPTRARDASAEETVVPAIEFSNRIWGMTAVEDKLQDGVPETMSALKKAGIKIWMLTGDRADTAANVGHATRMLDKGTTLLQVTKETTNAAIAAAAAESMDSLELQEGLSNMSIKGMANASREYFHEMVVRQLQRYHQRLHNGHGEDEHYTSTSGRRMQQTEESPLLRGARQGASVETPNVSYSGPSYSSGGADFEYALLIDGACLMEALSVEAEPLLLELGLQCACVIACRVSPQQKAQLVKLVSEGTLIDPDDEYQSMQQLQQLTQQSHACQQQLVQLQQHFQQSRLHKHRFDWPLPPPMNDRCSSPFHPAWRTAHSIQHGVQLIPCSCFHTCFEQQTDSHSHQNNQMIDVLGRRFIPFHSRFTPFTVAIAKVVLFAWVWGPRSLVLVSPTRHSMTPIPSPPPVGTAPCTTRHQTETWLARSL